VGSCFYTPTTARDIVWHWQSQRSNNYSLKASIDVKDDDMHPRSVLACYVLLLLFLTTLDHHTVSPTSGYVYSEALHHVQDSTPLT